MRIVQRDIDIIKFVYFHTTVLQQQLHIKFFPDRNKSACRVRMKKLVDEGYLRDNKIGRLKYLQSSSKGLELIGIERNHPTYSPSLATYSLKRLQDFFVISQYEIEYGIKTYSTFAGRDLLAIQEHKKDAFWSRFKDHVVIAEDNKPQLLIVHYSTWIDSVIQDKVNFYHTEFPDMIKKVLIREGDDIKIQLRKWLECGVDRTEFNFAKVNFPFDFIL